MNTQLEADLLSVGGLFSEPKTQYEIPIYQRNYAWGKEQIDQLIDDVWSAAHDPNVGEYFLGNLIVAPKISTNGSENSTYVVVDGQQRLTTLYMLLNRLGIDRVSKLTYASRRSATEALSQLSNSADDEGSGILTGYKTIRESISRLEGDIVSFEVFKEFLNEKVQLVRAILPDETDLNRYFEVMNTRGQQLEQVDIVKARLMSYLRAKDGDIDDSRASLAWIWDACADMDRYIQMSMTPQDTALRSRIFGEKWDRLEVQSFEKLVAHCPKGTPGRSARLESVRLHEAIVDYARIHDEPAEDPNDAARFESPIRFPSLLLHALKFVRARGSEPEEIDGHLDDAKLVKLFDEEFKSLSEQDRSNAAKELIETLLRYRFILDNFILKREFTSTNGEDGAWSLKRLMRTASGRGGQKTIGGAYPSSFALSSEESDEETRQDATRDVLLLQSLLRVTFTSPRNMHWITHVLSAPVLEVSRQEAAQVICERLRTYIRKKVRDSLPGESGPTGFEIERIVYTYLDYLLATGDGTEEEWDSSFVFQFRNSVEHFFPQHANRDDEGWDSVLSIHPELNMFGNLALVSVSANSKFSNALPSYKTKKVDIIHQSKKLELMSNIVKEEGVWDRSSIRRHHDKMVDLLRKDLRQAGLLDDRSLR